jgi:hypothetical protein
VRNPTQRNYLVVCFQADSGPYWVAEEYLFGLSPETVLPIRDEEAFQKEMFDGNISVDWLFEKILSAAQHLVTANSELLLAARQKGLTPGQIQRVLMHCVGCAARLIFCRVMAQWAIPPEKGKLVRETIERAVAPKFSSTKTILTNVERALRALSPAEDGKAS